MWRNTYFQVNEIYRGISATFSTNICESFNWIIRRWFSSHSYNLSMFGKYEILHPAANSDKDIFSVFLKLDTSLVLIDWCVLHFVLFENVLLKYWSRVAQIRAHINFNYSIWRHTMFENVKQRGFDHLMISTVCVVYFVVYMIYKTFCSIHKKWTQ